MQICLLICLPANPTRAISRIWWRWWKPYGAAIAYGAALGLGFTTRIYFGAFYVLCLWSFLGGNIIYGALLMGAYGASRALALIPASIAIYRQSGNSRERCLILVASRPYAQAIVAMVLLVFGLQLILSAVFSV